ncbi:MAG TPA: SMI1/KNR4 family protein [Polyangiaceae bacterium]|nr:SMI1/KNR4 family protein [Polyangiaceae bacterium]
MAHRYVKFPFRAEGFGPASFTHVTVASRAVSVEVDLATGAVIASNRGYERKEPPDASRTLRGLTERIVESAAGPMTELSNRDGAAVRFSGELSQAWRSDDFVLGVVLLPEGKAQCVALLLGGTEMLRLPVSRESTLAGHARFAACAFEGVVHVVASDGAVFRSASMALPPSHPDSGPDLFFAGSKVCVLCADTLLVLEATELPFDGAHVALPIRYEAMAGGGQGDPEPGRVAFVLPQSILVDHPRLKRLRLSKNPGSPDIAKGDHVLIDDFREALPGIFEVQAWHKAGTEAHAPGAAPALELPRPSVTLEEAPAGGARDVAPPGDAKRLEVLAARHGFAVSDLLSKLLRMRESDRIFRRWLDAVGFGDINVRGLTADWNADPNLLAICGLGNGDEYALYVYPPWCQKGREPPVVEYLHETNFVEFRARTFEAFFENELQRRIDEEGADRALVDAIREQLQLPQTARPVGEPLPWLPIERGRPAELQNIEGKSDTERELLQTFLTQGSDAPRAAQALERIYRKRGWTFALENIVERHESA